MTPAWHLRWTLLSYLSTFEIGALTPLVGLVIAVGGATGERPDFEMWAEEARARSGEGLCDWRDGGVGDEAKIGITAVGLEWVRSVEVEQNRGMKRGKAARDACLMWLEGQIEVDARPGRFEVEEMAGFNYYYGRKFTDSEIDEAAKWLVKHGYIEGTTAWGVAILHPSFTAKGEWAVNQNEPVSDLEGAIQARSGGTHNTITNFGSIGSAQQAGSRSSQAATVTDDHRQAMRELVAAFDEARPALAMPEGDKATVAAAVEAVRVAADAPETSPGLARELVATVRSELMLRSAGFVAGAIASRALEVYQALGG